MRTGDLYFDLCECGDGDFILYDKFVYYSRKVRFLKCLP